MTKFKPMLAPNDKVNLDDIQYPSLASFKLDGIRSEFISGEMLSRSLKPIQNKQLRIKLARLAEFSQMYGDILDGEIYSPKLTFQLITKFVMTQDFEDKKSIKKYGEVLTIPKHLKYYLFDVITNNNLDELFKNRVIKVKRVAKQFPDLIEIVEQFEVNFKEEVEVLFEKALNQGYEGLILKDPSGRYKCGRGTIKEGLIYKVKPFETFDAKILDVVQATEVDSNAEKKINELGRSVTSKKKGDRILINKASAFEVKYKDLNLKVVIAMTDEEKEKVWINRESYIGRIIEYKGMLVGSKDVPRHPVMIRFREDK